MNYNKDYEYKIKTVDKKGNRSEGVYIKYKSSQSSQTGEIIVEDTNKTVVDELKVIEVTKYNGIFTKYEKILNKVVKALDDYISKKQPKDSVITKRNSIINIRNELVKILKKLDTSNKDNKKDIIKEFKSLLLKLKKEITSN